jgi:HEAT repeat protein
MPKSRHYQQEIIANEGSSISNVLQKITNVYNKSDLEILNDYLAKAVASFEARIYQSITTLPSTHQNPYKFLYAYDVQDKDIYFGREKASAKLIQSIQKDRLTILHANSGAGKTSIINAGISFELIQNGQLPIYARAYRDPVNSIKQAICSHMLGPWPDILDDLGLQEFLGLVCAHLSRKTKEIIIIFDQFEEYYIFWPDKNYREPFLQEVSSCYFDEMLPLRFLISIRKDYYSDLADFRPFIPSVFYNEYRLDAMTHAEARTAITEPLNKTNRKIEYQEALVEALLTDLSVGSVDLPQLQIICTQLFENLADNEAIILYDSYEEFGRSKGILSVYLSKTLEELPSSDRDLATYILKELVSSEATKRVLSFKALANRVQYESNNLKTLLIWLVNARLLRRYEDRGEIVYEMAHEYLIDEIKKWIDQSDLVFKRVQELLNREVENWRVHRTLIPQDRLNLIHDNWTHFISLDLDSRLCILSSVIMLDLNLTKWESLICRNTEEFEELLIKLLNDSNPQTQFAAIRILGSKWALPDIEGLGSDQPSIRERSVLTLGTIKDRRAIKPLLVLANDKDAAVRKAVVWALVEFDSPHVIDTLIKILHRQDELDEVREASAFALTKYADKRVTNSLTTILPKTNGNLRRAIIYAIGEQKDPEALDSLIQVLSSKDDILTETLVEAFLKLKNSKTTSFFESMVNQKDVFNRKIALVYLASIYGHKNALGFMSEEVNEKKKCVEDLQLIDEHYSLKLVKATLLDPSPEIREASINLLLGINPIGTSKIISPLVNDDATVVRRVTIRALGEIGDSYSVKCLMKKLIQGSKEEQEEVSEAIIKIGQPAVKKLKDIIQNERPATRRLAIQLLGQIWNMSDIIRLGSEFSSDRIEAIVKLGSQDSQYNNYDLLVLMLQDESNQVVEAAIYTLGDWDNQNSNEALINLLKSNPSSRNTQIALIEVLAETKNKDTIKKVIDVLASISSEDIEVQQLRNTAMRKLKSNFIKNKGVKKDLRILHLAEQLKDNNHHVRESAVRAFGQSNNILAVQFLVDALMDDDTLVSLEAIRGLAKLGDLRAINPLIRILREDNDVLRRSAAIVLGAIGDARAIEPLKECLDGYDHDVRKAAADALNILRERLSKSNQ